MAKGVYDRGGGDTPSKSPDTVKLFNATSAPIGIMHHDGTTVTAIPPFSVTGTPIDGEAFAVWSKTQVGQAYLDKGLICTKKSDAIGFESTSDLVVPPELQAPTQQGSTESEIVKAPTLDGGVTLPVG